jgi:hypothetical protein
LKKPLSRPADLVAGLFICSFLDLRSFCAEEGCQPVVSISSDNQARRDRGLAICDKGVSANLLHLPAIGFKYVFLAFSANLQWVEDNGLSIPIDLFGRCLDVREFGINGGEGGVTKTVGLLDVWRDVLVWLRQVGNEGLSEPFITSRCQVQRFGAVRVCLEGGDGIADDGVGVEMLLSSVSRLTRTIGGLDTYGEESRGRGVAVDLRRHGGERFGL